MFSIWIVSWISMSVNIKKMADPQIGPDPSVGSSPAFIRARLALASSYVKKRLYFSLLICDPNPPRHPFFPYKAKKESHRCDSITCWWRWGESNPCPKSLSHKPLRVQFTVLRFKQSIVQEQTAFADLGIVFETKVPSILPLYPIGWCQPAVIGKPQGTLAD